MPAPPQHVAHAPRAVADRVAPVGRRDPLVDDHRRRRDSATRRSAESAFDSCRVLGRLRAIGQSRRRRAEYRASGSSGSARNSAGRNWRSSSSRSNWSNCGPEVPGDLRGRRGPAAQQCRSTKRSSVPPKSFARRRAERRVLRREDRVLDIADRRARRPSAARSRADPCVSYSTPPPSIVAGTAVAA